MVCIYFGRILNQSYELFMYYKLYNMILHFYVYGMNLADGFMKTKKMWVLRLHQLRTKPYMYMCASVYVLAVQQTIPLGSSRTKLTLW